MGRRFDSLGGEQGDEQSSGITALDLADLPQPLPKILRLLLRQVQMTRTDLRAAVSAFPEADRLTPEELDHAIDALHKHGWIMRSGDPSLDAFRVNLRRKVNNTGGDDYRPRRRSGGMLAEGLWSALERDERAKEPDDPAAPPAPK